MDLEPVVRSNSRRKVHRWDDWWLHSVYAWRRVSRGDKWTLIGSHEDTAEERDVTVD